MDKLTKKELKEIKAISNGLKPEFNIGKQGITENNVELIEKYLKAHSIVKIKVLAAISKEQVQTIAEELTSKIADDTFIVEKKGFTFTLYMYWK